MNELALFAGAGGGILGGHLLGWRTVCAVEWEPYAACVLAARQNDGIFPPFPIWDDIQTFDGRPWRGIVDVVSGGFPCQDISAAGRGAGIEGERSGMWREMARVVGEVRPRYVYIENSPMLTARGGARVIADLTALGYDAQWDVMGAADVGAPHQRDRIWIFAKRRDIFSHSEYNGDGWREQQSESVEKEKVSMAYTVPSWERRDEWQSKTKRNVEMADTTNGRNVWRDGFMGVIEQENHHRGSQTNGRGEWWDIEPDVGRVANGVAARVDRLKAIGNGQVPAVAATAWNLLRDNLC
ncbi:MAG: DNA cytosine methyltransferase [Betaproteobacteria bacterium]|nr:DNA cytosine methyltransferase [Betaproteobacteria bacterium]